MPSKRQRLIQAFQKCALSSIWGKSITSRSLHNRNGGFFFWLPPPIFCNYAHRELVQDGKQSTAKTRLCRFSGMNLHYLATIRFSTRAIILIKEKVNRDLVQPEELKFSIYSWKIFCDRHDMKCWIFSAKQQVEATLHQSFWAEKILMIF